MSKANDKTPFDQMARHETRLLHKAKGLAKLWRTVVYECDIDADRLYGLITRWVNENNTRDSDHPNYRSNDRGNLIKALGKPNISYKVFMRGLQILRPLNVELVCNIKWRANYTTSHSVTVNMNVLEDPMLTEKITEADIDNAVESNTGTF